MTIAIISGYFNPLHLGHLKMIEDAKTFSDKVIVIVNNDKQQLLKKDKIIMNEKERSKIVKALKDVDEVILSIDEDKSVRKTLALIAERYPDEQKFFCNGGDRRNSNDIPEGETCREHRIRLKFAVGGYEKINSSTNINQLNGKE